MSAALFDAPELEGQGALFGGVTMTADEFRELVADQAPAGQIIPQADSCPACGSVHAAYVGTPYVDQCPRVLAQRDVYHARANEAREHRRTCEICAQRGRCKDSRKLDTEVRLSCDVLRMIKRGEL